MEQKTLFYIAQRPKMSIVNGRNASEKGSAAERTERAVLCLLSTYHIGQGRVFVL